MRLLLVGAFAFPHAQGSQVYFREQALALRDAGAEIHLLTYGPGRIDPARIDLASDLRAEPEADLEQTNLPDWAAPRSRRSGPSLGKPVADLALTARLRRLVASPVARPGSGSPHDRLASAPAASTRSTRSAGGFDAILAHHVEAALAAIHGLPRTRPPIVYCAHTLLEQELPFYFGARSFKDPLGSPARRRALARLGGALDRWIARRADGWIALTQSSERVLRASSRALGQQVGPPVSDPDAIADRRDDARRLAANGLAPRGYFLYCGNLDPYQDLPLLEQVARRRSSAGARVPGAVARAPAGRPLPLVVATHAVVATDARAERSFGLEPAEHAVARRLEQAGVRVVPLRSAAEARALFAGALATIVPRRSLGGFPIKLVNSLAAGTPVVAYHGEEWGLVDGHEGLIADPAEPIQSMADALSRLESDAALAERLGHGARARYTAEHRPALAAAATLELIRAVVARRSR